MHILPLIMNISQTSVAFNLHLQNVHCICLFYFTSKQKKSNTKLIVLNIALARLRCLPFPHAFAILFAGFARAKIAFDPLLRDLAIKEVSPHLHMRDYLGKKC